LQKQLIEKDERISESSHQLGEYEERVAGSENKVSASTAQIGDHEEVSTNSLEEAFNLGPD
jgi:hypothetical protein